jgi:hypothetical protein
VNRSVHCVHRRRPRRHSPLGWLGLVRRAAVDHDGPARELGIRPGPGVGAGVARWPVHTQLPSRP